MFPSIDNNFKLKTVFEILESLINELSPTQSVIEALNLHLACNNYIFNNKNYLQTDGTTQGSHMFCSYADLALETFETWSNGLVVKVLDSQSRGPVIKTTGWLQGRLSLSSFQGQ